MGHSEKIAAVASSAAEVKVLLPLLLLCRPLRHRRRHSSAFHFHICFRKREGLIVRAHVCYRVYQVCSRPDWYGSSGNSNNSSSFSSTTAVAEVL